MKRHLEFVHAIFERRLTDAGIEVEYTDLPVSGGHYITETLHDQTAVRMVEAVENLARVIVYSCNGKHSKIRCTHLTIGSSEIRTTVFEFKGTK